MVQETELEKLIQEKKEIEDRIRSLRNKGEVNRNGFRLYKGRTGCGKGAKDRPIWRLSARRRNEYRPHGDGTETVILIESDTREGVIDLIPLLDHDWQEFLKGIGL